MSNATAVHQASAELKEDLSGYRVYRIVEYYFRRGFAQRGASSYFVLRCNHAVNIA